MPTELCVEKTPNAVAENVGREKFVQPSGEDGRCSRGIQEVVEVHGVSVDWSLLYTTIDRNAQKASQLSFLDLYEMGRVYRKETPTIWCPKEKPRSRRWS